MPITYADAVEEARKFFYAISKTSEIAHSAKGIHEPGALKAQTLQGHGVRRVLDEPDKIIADARRNPDAFDALRFGAAQLIAIRVELPPQINFWVAKYLQGKVERPVAKSGRGSSLGFHMQIMVQVDSLVAKGMTATRNDASKKFSACDAVAEALGMLDLKPSSYDRVKAVYSELKRLQREDGGIPFDKDGTARK